MSIETDLQAFYREKGFGETIGQRTPFVKVYTGCLLVPFPNIETRHRYLKYHDLHHIITGYSVGRIGEGEMSSWELGSGSMWRNPLIGVMNLVALSTGWFLKRERMWLAFASGRRSRNLYAADTRAAVDADRWANVAELRAEVLECFPERRLSFWKKTEFRVYISISLVMHLAVAAPAVLLRYFSDVRAGHGILGALQPRVRMDVF